MSWFDPYDWGPNWNRDLSPESYSRNLIGLWIGGLGGAMLALLAFLVLSFFGC